MKRLTLSILFCALSSAATANQANFARGIVLDSGDDAYVQRVTMPDDVYEWVTRRDLGDVRIFNRDQEEVPYTIRRPQRTEEYAPWETLPLFPLPTATGELTTDPRLEIRVDDVGSIVAYGGAVRSEDRTTAFLLDASTLQQTPTELRLSWDGLAEDDFVGRVRVETSDDLDKWRVLIDATTIARLANDGQTVTLDRIELPPRKARYLRVSQVEGNEALALLKAEVRHRRSELPARRWKTLAASARDDGFEFDAGGRFPIDRVRLTQAGEASYLVTVQLHSRRSADEDWRNRGLRTFYRTTIAGQTVASDPIAYADPDRHWRVEFDGAALSNPVLEIGWLPDEVVFLKQGAAPYVIAYGQADVQAREWPLSQLLERLNGGRQPMDLADVPFARPAEPQMLGGPDRLVPPAEPIDWQTVVLWSVLVLGVLMVGAFAFRLLRSDAEA